MCTPLYLLYCGRWDRVIVVFYKRDRHLVPDTVRNSRWHLGFDTPRQGGIGSDPVKSATCKAHHANCLVAVAAHLVGEDHT
jgi:hypothetical protein